MKFNSGLLLFEPFFDVQRIFSITEPQSESNFPFLYVKNFKHTVLWKPLAPLMGGQTYALADFFVRNSILNNFYSEFFYVMRIISSGESRSESSFPFLYIIRVVRD